MWTPELLSEEMQRSYVLLGERSEALHRLETGLYDAQAELTRVREWHRLNDDPKVLGSNEAQRQAALAEKCKIEAAVVSTMERQRMDKRADVEKVRSWIEHLKVQLRILELAAGLQHAA